MTVKAFILTLLSAGLAAGQSSVQNVPYEPVLRLGIPYIQPRDVLITNGTVMVHPEAGIEYTDFVLQCIDQTGTRGTWEDQGWFEWVDDGFWEGEAPDEVWVDTSHNEWHSEMVFVPVLWNYDSRQAGGQQFSDDAAVCFYTDAAGQRRRQYFSTVTNLTVISVATTNWTVEGWNTALATTNAPSRILLTYWGSSYWMERTNDVNGFPAYYRQTWPSYPGGGTNWTYHTDPPSYGWRMSGSVISQLIGTNFHNSAVTPEPVAYFSNPVIETNYITRTNVFQGGTVRSHSGGAAYAIEVYPTKTHPHFKDFKPWDSGVRWVAMLHNGSNFYSNAETGEPVLFEVRKDWIQKIPDEGQW